MPVSDSSAAPTSIDKALEVCEVLSAVPSGLSLTDLAKAVGRPRPSVHRLLAVLKRRGYVRQDDESQRYSLTLKMLDLSFRLLGRSEIRLHAYPLMRDHALRSVHRSFVAVPAASEVSYIWSAGPDDVAMRTAFGREMPAHCAVYFGEGEGQAPRRLSCLRLERASDVEGGAAALVRFGRDEGAGAQRLFCTCAPVYDYTGREVARVGMFGHGPDEAPILTSHNRGAWELGRQVSRRLGHLPSPGHEAH